MEKDMSSYLVLGIIIVLAVVIYRSLTTFIPTIFLAIILAYLFYPLYEAIKKRTKREKVSAFILLALILVVILIPITLTFIAVGSQLDVIVNIANPTVIRESVTTTFNSLNQTGIIQVDEAYREQIVNSGLSALNYLIGRVASALFSLTDFVFQIFIMFFLLYFFFTQGKNMMQAIPDLLPLKRKDTIFLVKRTANSIKGLVVGQGFVALVQGLLGGVGFMLFGVPNALLWGMVMVFFSFLPYIGAFLVWGPAAIILVFQGNTVPGIGLFLWGFLLVSTIDNFLRPHVVDSLAQIHPLTTLFGVFMGVSLFGFVGVIIGPIILSVFMALLKLFHREYIAH